MERKKTLFTVDEGMVQINTTIVGISLEIMKKLKREVASDPVLSFLAIYSENNTSHYETFIPHVYLCFNHQRKSTGIRIIIYQQMNE